MATLPKTIGTCADNLYKMKQEMSKLKKKQDAELGKIKKKYNELEEHVLGLLNTQKSTGGKGKSGQVTKKHGVSPTIEDFGKLWKYMQKEDAPDLLSRKLSTTAIKERWDAGVTIPGVGKYDRIKLSVTKAS